MRVLTVDVGGSGVKTAMFEDGRLAAPPQTTAYGDVDLARLVPWLRARFAGPVDAVAVAVPGMIAADGARARFYVAPGGWHDYDLAAALRSAFAIPNALALNDAEAAAAAAVGVVDLPLVHLTLGTGVGVAALDDGGRWVRPHRDGSFNVSTIDVGSAGPAWQAIGAAPLAVLERERGVEAALGLFAHRVAILARTLTTMFQPRGVSLSGGILATHPALAARVDARLARLLPDWHGPTFGIPPVRGLPDPAHAALRGLDRVMRHQSAGTIPLDRALP